MEKQINKKPLLRFPQFKEEWEVKKLGEFLIHTPRPKQKPKKNYLSIGIRSHFKGTFQKPDTDPNKNVMDTLYEVKENDFLVNITFAWEGALAIVPKEDDGGLVSHRFPTYIFDNGLNNFFFKYLFFGEKSKHQLGIVSPGGAGRNRVMNKKDFIKIKLSFPSLYEQKKIANFLTTLDQKIKHLQEKKKTLEQYKKGIMQQIFSQELRFKDEHGKGFGDWEVKTLGEVLTIGSGKDYKHLKNGSIPVYGSGGYMTSVDKYLFEGESVCIGRKGTIDKPKYFNEKFWTVDTLFYTHSFVNALPKFIFYLFLNINWKMYNEASGVPSLSKKTIESISVLFPTLKEQSQIANFLTKIDAKINAVNSQEKIHEFSLLLQRMFV